MSKRKNHVPAFQVKAARAGKPASITLRANGLASDFFLFQEASKMDTPDYLAGNGAFG